MQRTLFETFFPELLLMMVFRFRVGASLLAAGVLFSGANPAFAQTYPSKPIRVITAGIGGGNDVSARLIAQGLTTAFGQQAIVDNRASGIVTAEAVAKAPPDGYTVLVYGSTVWITPLLQSTPYDPVTDYAAISSVASSPHVIVVHPSLPVKTLGDLIKLAKAKPGQLNDASLGTGTATHLAAELFKSMAGVNIVRIPYKSAATQIADLLGGQVQLTFSTTGAVTPHINSGRLRALAVTSAGPSTLAPGLPTVASFGLSGFEAGAFYVMFAPAKTPAAIITRLNQEVVRYLGQAETREKFFSAGLESGSSTPEALTAKMKFEMARLGKLIKDVGIRVE
jgi:tripartite-type tricarboxylate transporter receptor subunit TctC